ncbi:MAG: pentapeptide repeat-containing protein [Flavobacteriaceae bacterium]|nr:pentapeptide repeat-containing protein [Flavobacteriaceae bacterium]
MPLVVEDQTFKGVNYTETGLTVGDYEQCSFTNCNFANVDLSGINFIDCSFEQCDMSMAKEKKTALKTVTFKGCKMLGINFGECMAFLLQLHFDDCLLNHASFYQLKLKGIKFKNCKLIGIDFVETDLPQTLFQNCDLTDAVIEKPLFEKADFRTAFNYAIDPELNEIKAARFSLQGLPGLLNKYRIEVE